jgi:hypothetical protein
MIYQGALLTRFDIKGYKFDSGPSLFSGFQSRGPQANPLAQVIFLFVIVLVSTFCYYNKHISWVNNFEKLFMSFILLSLSDN